MEIIYFQEKGLFSEEWDKLRQNNKDIKFTSINEFRDIPLDKKIIIFTPLSYVHPWMNHSMMQDYNFGEDSVVLFGPNRVEGLSGFIDKHVERFLNMDYVSLELRKKNMVLDAHECVDHLIRFILSK